MPHIDDMSTALQTALKQVIPAKCSVEIILDPGGLDMDLSAYVLRDAPMAISRRKSIQPYGSVGQFSIAEISIDLVNSGDIFNHNRKGAPFYYAVSRLSQDKGAADAYVRVPPGAADRFDDPSITSLVVSNGTTSAAFTISSIVTGSSYDQINFSASGSIAFTGGSIIETPFLPGRKVQISTVIAGQAEKVLQFTGILKGHPALSAGRARLVLFDPLKDLLDVDITANDYRLIDGPTGVANSTLEYARASDPGSSGTLDMDQVVLAASTCKVGSWLVLFINGSGGYKITDPDGEEYFGDTGSAGSFPATDTQLTIPAAAWSGTFELDDEISFDTVLALGPPVNSYRSIPAMIEALLLQAFGAGLTTGQIDQTAFSDLILDYDEMVGTINYTRPTSVLKALEVLQQHISGTIFSLPDGRITISAYRPRRDAPTLAVLSPDAEITELTQEDLGRLDRVRSEYSYSQAESRYLNEVRIPDGAKFDGKELTIRMPAYHSDAQARAAAERIFIMWRKGVKAYRIREKWNYGLGLAINELVRSSSLHPLLASRPVDIYETAVDVSGQTVDISAYDLNYALEGFLILDVDKVDIGKVIW